MQLLKHNKRELQYQVDDDEVIEKYCRSSYANDKKRKLPVKIMLFIASEEGYESTVKFAKELNKLVKRYELVYHKFVKRQR